MASTMNTEAAAASELLEDQVIEEGDETVVPVHDDAGPPDAEELVGHDLDYIVEIPAHN